MNEPDIKPETVILLNYLVLAQAIINVQDKLVQTPYFRREIKFHSKKIEEAILKQSNKDLADLFQADEEVMQEAVEAWEQLTAIMASSNVENMIFVKRIFEAVELGILTPEQLQKLIDNGRL